MAYTHITAFFVIYDSANEILDKKYSVLSTNIKHVHIAVCIKIPAVIIQYIYIFMCIKL